MENEELSFQEALAYLMHKTRHKDETLKEFSHRKFRADRLKKKLIKNKLVIPNE